MSQPSGLAQACRRPAPELAEWNRYSLSLLSSDWALVSLAAVLAVIVAVRLPTVPSLPRLPTACCTVRVVYTLC